MAKRVCAPHPRTDGCHQPTAHARAGCQSKTQVDECRARVLACRRDAVMANPRQGEGGDCLAMKGTTPCTPQQENHADCRQGPRDARRGAQTDNIGGFGACQVHHASQGKDQHARYQQAATQHQFVHEPRTPAFRLTKEGFDVRAQASLATWTLAQASFIDADHFAIQNEHVVGLVIAHA